MKTNDLFNFHRISMLARQNFIHNYKLIALALAGLFGGIFIILFLVQTADDFRPWHIEELVATFLFIFIAVGVIYAGTSFPSLRTKEKSYSFLQVPVSTFEKYTFEFATRIILYIIAMPLIFWIVYVMEGYFSELVIPGYEFNIVPISINRLIDFRPDEMTFWVYVLFYSVAFLIFNIPFTGSTIFMKHPLLKTLFSLAVIFFFHMFLLFFFLEILDFKNHAHHGMSILFIDDEKDAVRFFAIYSLLVNVALIAVSYLKLKEKEV